MKIRYKSRMVGAVAVLTIVVGACGSDDDDSVDTTPATHRGTGRHDRRASLATEAPPGTGDDRGAGDHRGRARTTAVGGDSVYDVSLKDICPDPL